MTRHILHQIDDTIFVVKNSDDEEQIRIWLEENIGKDYHVVYDECYTSTHSVLTIAFDRVSDAILFKMAWDV